MKKTITKATLKALANHLQKGGYDATYNSYFRSVQLFTVDFMAADLIQMLKDEGFDAWSNLTGRTVGSFPQAVIYAR
jgi:hypothetical protein